MAAHARRRQAGLRAVSNDRCLAPGCRRTVTWIEDLADGGVTIWTSTQGPFVVRDGVAAARPVRRSTFYRHTEGWLQIR